MAGAIYFNGSELTGHTVSLNGTEMANVWLNGTKIWTEYTPTANTYTSNTTEQLDDRLSQITIEIAGAGGGGCGGDSNAPSGAAGATGQSMCSDGSRTAVQGSP